MVTNPCPECLLCDNKLLPETYDGQDIYGTYSEKIKQIISQLKSQKAISQFKKVENDKDPYHSVQNIHNRNVF